MKFKYINAELLYWYAEFGRSRRKISVDELKRNLHAVDSPVFFLSTGRTGTQWFARLFSSARGIKAYHAPSPDLAGQNCFAYRIQKEGALSREMTDEILGHIFLAGREQYLRYSYKCMRRYLETNNHITFFAYSIAHMLPQARFVHVHRHPGDFVSSGLKRHWYQNDHPDIRQIVPVEATAAGSWPEMDPIQKIAWLWKETNEYIEAFKSSIPPDRVFTFNFTSMNPDTLKDLIAFTGAEISESKVGSMIGRRLNDQQFQASETYEGWSSRDKEQLAEICGPLAARYAYTL